MTGPFHYVRDPGADGVGVAFTSAEVNLSGAQDASARAAAFDGVSVAVGAPIAVVTQVHGNRVLPVDDRWTPASASGGLLDLTSERADALVTTTPGLALAVRVADCIPVLLADSHARVVGAAHAGRAGVLNGVIGEAVEAMRARGASHLHAWIGPHICARCYEVPPDMAADFESVTGVPPTTTSWGSIGLDLGEAARRQLDALGVEWESHEACTLHDPGLHSYRRDAAAAGRLAGLVWLT